MASILDRYGIKEVADVVFWDTATGKPVLYLDTLKVSTIEETAEQTEARGGKGNPPLIIWDYGKEITITLEDALFSMKSMAVMHNSKPSDPSDSTGGIETATFVRKAIQFETNEAGVIPASIASISGIKYYSAYGIELSASEKSFPNPADPNTSVSLPVLDSTSGKYIGSYLDANIVNAQQVVVTSNDFPGTYRITGDTYARSQDTGKDEFFQFEVPLAKINPEQTITMQAEGDPSTFSMTVRVMRPSDGKMMTLTKYSQGVSASGTPTEGNG